MSEQLIDYDKIVSDVLQSDCLGRSDRQRKLFEYLVDKTKLGETSLIKQYTIALDVLSRKDDFDPQIDSIVRVEMHRLRNSLGKFSKASPDYEISIPKGRYHVVVKRKPQTPQKTKKWSNLLTANLAVLASILIVGVGIGSVVTGNTNLFNKATAGQYCSKDVPNISLASNEPGSEISPVLDKYVRSIARQYTNFNIVPAGNTCSDEHTPSFLIEYVFSPNGKSLIALSVSNLISQKELVLAEFSSPISEDTYAGSVNVIARELSKILKPYGSLTKAALTEEWNSTEAKQNFVCLEEFYHYISTDTREDHETAHMCLENTSKLDSATLDILGALASSYMWQALGYVEPTVADPLEKAKSIVEGVGDRWIDGVEMAAAKMIFEANRPDFSVDRLRVVTSNAAERYSHHPIMLANTSLYMSFTIGDWEAAKVLSDRVKEIHTDRDHSIYHFDAVYAFVTQDDEAAKFACPRAYTETIAKFSIVTINACAHQIGDLAMIAKTEKMLHALGLNRKDDRIAYIESRNLEPILTSRLRDLYSN